MAHKKGQGSSRNGRDSNSQRLGVKASAARRHGRHDPRAAARHEVLPGHHVGRGKDDTLFAKIAGIVRYKDRGRVGRTISIEPVRQTLLTW